MSGLNDSRKEPPLKYRLISPFDYARIHNVHVNTVYTWIRKGYLHPIPYYTEPGQADSPQRRFKLYAHEPRPYPITGRNSGQYNAKRCQNGFDPENPDAQITMDEIIKTMD